LSASTFFYSLPLVYPFPFSFFFFFFFFQVFLIRVISFFFFFASPLGFLIYPPSLLILYTGLCPLLGPSTKFAWYGFFPSVFPFFPGNIALRAEYDASLYADFQIFYLSPFKLFLGDVSDFIRGPQATCNITRSAPVYPFLLSLPPFIPPA